MTPNPPDGLADLRPLPVARWVALLSLLLAEGMFLSQRFDTTPFADDGRWWAVVLAGSRGWARTGIAVGLAMILTGGVWCRGAPRGAAVRDSRPHRAWLFLIAHAAAFVGFVWITSVVFGGATRTMTHMGPWVFAWLATGSAALGFWCAAAIPPRSWVFLARAGWPALLAGVAVGLSASASGRLAEGEFWLPLSRATLWTVYGLLTLVCPDPVCRPADYVVGTPTFSVHVSAACSGYEGMGLILVFLGAYLGVYRDRYRFPQALLLLPAGAAVIWVANAFRIALLVLIGDWVSRDVAEGGFHSLAGWLAFNAVGLGLIVGTRRLKFFVRSDPQAGPVGDARPAMPYLAPLLAIVALSMVTGAFSNGFDRYYPLRVLAATAVLWRFRRVDVGLRRTWSWQAAAIGVVAFVLWMALGPAPAAHDAGSALAAGLSRSSRAQATFWLIFRVLGAVVTVPIAEELAFRGYLCRRLIAADFREVPPGRFTWTSFLVSSSLFGAVHDRWLAGTLAGLLYALALYRRGELTDAVVAHSTTNGLIAATVLTTRDWSLWA